MYNIFPSITTTTDSWRQMIVDVNKLGLSEVAIFPTAIGYSQRQELYKLLENSSVKHIPLVHIKDDMTREEIIYLSKTFETQKFNIHSQKQSKFILKNDLSEFNKMIYLELTKYKLGDELLNYGGICLDTAHVENQRLRKASLYDDFMDDLQGFLVGVAHINAILPKSRIDSWRGGLNYDSHKFTNLSEFDYVINYKAYLPDTICLELENSIFEQLMAKEYIRKLLV